MMCAWDTKVWVRVLIALGDKVTPGDKVNVADGVTVVDRVTGVDGVTGGGKVTANPSVEVAHANKENGAPTVIWALMRAL